MKKKRALALVLIGTLALSCLTACGEKKGETASSDNKKIKLTILRNTPQDLDTQFEKSAIEEFEKANPNVEIDYQQMAYENYITNLQTKLASGDAPDIFQLETSYIPKYVENGYVMELDNLESVKNIDTNDLANCMLDGTLYALGTGAGSMCVTYNKEVFEAAGISKVPETLDEFYEVCKKIKDSGVEPIANGFKESWTISGNIQADYIVGVLAQDANAIKSVCDRTATFADSDLWKQEFQRFFDRYEYSNSDPFGTDWNNACSMLATGKSGMILNGSWAVTNTLGVNPDASLGIFALPTSNTAEDTKLLLQGANGGWAVYKDSKNADMAKKFIDFISSPEQVSKACALTQTITVVKGVEVGDNPAIQDMQAYINNDKVFRQGNIDHNFPNEQRDALEKTLSEHLVNKNYDVDSLCKSLDEQFERIVK